MRFQRSGLVSQCLHFRLCKIDRKLAVRKFKGAAFLLLKEN